MITKVDIDCHRWECYINVHNDDGTVETTIVVMEDGSGLFTATLEEHEFYKKNGYWE